MLDLTTLNWLPGERVWMRPSVSGPEIEIVIAGDERAPHAARVLHAEDVLQQIDEVRKQATAYLDFFVDRTKFARNSQWDLDSIEFGRSGDEPFSEFVAYFSLAEDVYGLWSVLFRNTTDAGIVPIEFSRRQQ